MPYTYEYPRPAVTVDAIVFRIIDENIEVLLIKRLHAPFEGMWAIPGGFINLDETLEAAAARELEEETGIKDIDLKYFGVFGDVNRDPRQRTICIAFTGLLKHNGIEANASDDAAECQWFNINSIPEELAFDHNKIIKEAIKFAEKGNLFKIV